MLGVNIGNKRQVSVVEQGYVNIFIKDTGRVSVEQGHFRAVLIKDKCIQKDSYWTEKEDETNMY